MRIIEKIWSYRADVVDIGLVKIAVIAAALLIAKLWQPILGLEWYWYLLVCIAAAVRPFSTFLKCLQK
jgi:hypothetical protein